MYELCDNRFMLAECGFGCYDFFDLTVYGSVWFDSLELKTWDFFFF